MLDAVKRSMGITSGDPMIEQEISDLIEAALYDLQTNGVNVRDTQDLPPVLQAVKTYVRAHFHSPADYDKLLAAYEEQKGHLMNTTGFTVWPLGVGTDGAR